MFVWITNMYHNLLKVYDTKIIQYLIPLKFDTYPFQYKLCKIHPSLKPLIQKELRKLLDVKTIFSICHSSWIINLFLLINRCGNIRLYVGFKNLNTESKIDNYHVTPMEQILQLVTSFEMLPPLDKVFGQSSSSFKSRWLNIDFKTKWGAYAYKEISFGLMNASATCWSTSHTPRISFS
jgi:hypothetical protein